MDKKQSIFNKTVKETRSFITDLIWQGFKGYHSYVSFAASTVFFILRMYMDSLKEISFAWVLLPLFIWVLLAYAYCRYLYYKLKNFTDENIEIEKLENLYEEGKKIHNATLTHAGISEGTIQEIKSWNSEVSKSLPRKYKFQFDNRPHPQDQHAVNVAIVNKNIFSPNVVGEFRYRYNKLYDVIIELKRNAV